MSGGPLRRLLSVTRLNAVPAPYAPILALQEALAERRRAGDLEDTMLLLQHAPVYTIGKRGSAADFLADVRAHGAAVETAPRGGETTFHGPGQLVAYPVVSLRAARLGARAYVEALEDAMVAVAGWHGVPARGRLPRRAGAWVGDRKLGAVGVRVSRGVATHGLALNVAPDLAAFDAIVPCGERRRGVATSLAAEVDARGGSPPPALGGVAEELAAAVAAALGFAGVRWLDGDVLALAAAHGLLPPEGLHPAPAEEHGEL